MSAPAEPQRRPGLFTRLGRWSDRQLLRRLPEYHLFPTEEARIRATKELDEQLERSRSFWRAVAAIAIAGTILANLSFCIVPMVSPWRFRGLGSGSGVVAGLIAVAAIGAVVWTWRRGVARRLRSKLIESGVPVCRACGYPMRGLGAREPAEVRCPECGWKADGAVSALIIGAGRGPGAA